MKILHENLNYKCNAFFSFSYESNEFLNGCGQNVQVDQEERDRDD